MYESMVGLFASSWFPFRLEIQWQLVVKMVKKKKQTKTKQKKTRVPVKLRKEVIIFFRLLISLHIYHFIWPVYFLFPLPAIEACKTEGSWNDLLRFLAIVICLVLQTFLLSSI